MTKSMNVERIDHLAIAVKKLEDHIEFYEKTLGLSFLGIEEVPDQMVRVAMFQIGESRIELLEPTDPKSTTASFLEKRGEGLHHVAYKVKDVEAAIDVANEKEIRMIDKKPRTGAGGCQIAFIHPRSSGRVLSELTNGEHEH